MKFNNNKNSMKIEYQNNKKEFIEIKNEDDYNQFKQEQNKIIKVSDLNKEKNNLNEERKKRKFELLKYIRKNKYNSVVIENCGITNKHDNNTLLYYEDKGNLIENYFPSIKNI